MNVQAYVVKNPHTASELRILSSDVATSWGVTPDFIVADELAHWKEPARSMWDSLLSSAAKRAKCLMLVITNAGFQGSWQWQVREAVRSDPAWHLSRLEGPVASWFSEEQLAEQERLLPNISFRRLWLNQWSSGAGDAIPDEQIEAAIVCSGPMSGQEPDFREYGFVAGLDLGVKRDHSAMVVLGCHYHSGRVRLALCQSWAPPRGGEVDLTMVQTRCWRRRNAST